MNSTSQLNHEGEFERAWADRSNTRVEPPSVDVNRVLAEHYRTSEPLTFNSVVSQGHSMRGHGHCFTSEISLMTAALGRSICRR